MVFPNQLLGFKLQKLQASLN